jgi:hypothetical protein
MADETSHEQTPDPDSGATPNRDRRHEPPIIDGEVAETESPAEAQEDSRPAQVEPPVPAAASSSPEPPPAAAPVVKSSRPVMSALIGAFVGAIVAAIAVWLSGIAATADSDFATRLARLEKGVAAPNAAVEALGKRVSALEAAASAAPDKTTEALGQRVAALEAAALSAKAASDSSAGALSEAQAARADAAKALALASQASASAPGAASAPAPTAPPPDGALSADVDALQGRVGKLETALAAVDRPPPVDLAPLNQRLEKLETAFAAPKNETRVPPENAPSSRDWAGLAVVAEALTDRLRAGAPFALEETALEHLGADPAKLAPLKPLAEKGAPTAAALAADFAGIAPAIRAAAEPKNSGGVMDRLMANMGKVVRVTPVGEVVGDDPAALASQIGASLDRGQIAQALAAWQRLPEGARQASQEWAQAAQARLGADAAARSLLDEALTRLAATKS